MALGYNVRRFHNYCYMFSNLTEIRKSQKHYINIDTDMNMDVNMNMNISMNSIITTPLGLETEKLSKKITHCKSVG